VKSHLGKSLFFLACAGILLASVKTDYSHSVDWSRYKTYSWIKVSVEDPLWQDRVTRAVDTQLTAKGWTKVPDGGDASVAAYGSTKTQKTLQTWYDGFGGGWFWHGFGDGLATTTVQETPVGTLMVDIFDSSTKKLIWRGVASDTLSGKPEKDEKKMDKTVAEMFKNFPPGSKS
jgi:Domain of unknown function (DUF4136)